MGSEGMVQGVMEKQPGSGFLNIQWYVFSTVRMVQLLIPCGVTFINKSTKHDLVI